MTIQEKYNELFNQGFDCGGQIGFEIPLGNGNSMQTYSTGVVIYKHTSLGTYEVHGNILLQYNLLLGHLGDLGFPVSDEMNWIAEQNFVMGRVSYFQYGIIFWNKFSNQTLVMRIDTLNQFYWGIDSTAQFQDIVNPNAGKLFEKTKSIPAFVGQYLPTTTDVNNNQYEDFADRVQQVFKGTNAMSKIILIDNKVQNLALYNRTLGKNHALDACLRAENAIGKYFFKYANNTQVPDIVFPNELIIFLDVEPNWDRSLDYLEGWIDGFDEYLQGSPLTIFRPGIYMSFTPDRSFNTINLNAIKRNVYLWAQHPNVPTLTEKEIFKHGFSPLAPERGCGIWQFNNYDRRFAIKPPTLYWIDHDICTASYYNLFWKGDSRLYLI